MFEGQPKGLYALALCVRQAFGLLHHVLFSASLIWQNSDFTAATTSTIFASFLAGCIHICNWRYSG